MTMKLRERWASLPGKRLLRDLAIGAALVVAIGAWQGRNLLGSGNPAPGLVLQTLEGETVDLADFRGRKVLLYFWAPWCGVCRLQTPTVEGLLGGDVEVLGVAMAAEREAIESYAKEREMRMPVLLGDDRVASDWAVGVFPTLYIVDEEGRIENALVGYTSSLGLRLRLWL